MVDGLGGQCLGVFDTRSRCVFQENGLVHLRWRRRQQVSGALKRPPVWDDIPTYSPQIPMLGCCQERIPIQHGMARHSGDEDGKHWSTSSRRWIGLDRGQIGSVLARLAVP